MNDKLNFTIGAPPPEMITYPMLLLREPVIFPFILTPAHLETAIDEEALQEAMRRDRTVAIFFEAPDPDGAAHKDFDCTLPLFPAEERNWVAHGLAARILKVMNCPDGSTRILVRGIRRIRYVETVSDSKVRIGRVCHLPDENSGKPEIEAAVKAAMTLFGEISAYLPGLPDELKAAILGQNSPDRLADLIADGLNFDYTEKLVILARQKLDERMMILLKILTREVEFRRLGNEIQNEVQQTMNKQQREYFLREQLRAIRSELGEEFGNPDLADVEARIQLKQLPEAAARVARREAARLEIIPQSAPEYHIACSYLDWILELPWVEESEETVDIARAAKILDADHYGLKEVKDRILEFIAVLQLNEGRKAPILCLAGPPGVGKTSLGQSVARALNRNFVRAALGGVRDEAEIRGHRRTYVGALPGRIIQGMKRAGTVNPVFLLDEIDKLASDVRGDPASALLEVLDPEQNRCFNDHYLELDYDLSRIFFLTTANNIDAIPPALRDRMEIIELSGYTAFEKREIARRHLVPRQLAECGLTGYNVRFRASGLDELIEGHTRESGVRQLERMIGRVCRRLGRKLLEEKREPGGEPVAVDAKLVRELLGARLFLSDEAEKTPQTGCATGMAWTSAGGCILPVEAVMMPGKGAVKLTGSLGKVMQESAEAAFSFIRSRAGDWGIADSVFADNDFHIHVPDGATPKDGPSAGITMATALLSCLTGRPVVPRLAMTGEITLRGRITAIGGVREKVTAALRSGIRTVLIPEDNRKDVDELPGEIRSKVDVHFIRRFEEAAGIALLKEEKK